MVCMLVHDFVLAIKKVVLSQALLHASVDLRKKLVIDWIPACDLEDATEKEVSGYSVPSVATLFVFFFVSHLDKKIFLAESRCL